MESAQKKIALIQGGLGAEKKISHMTGASFAKALLELKYPFEVVEADGQLPVRLAQCEADVALLAVHGKYAEDGVAQALCEYLKIPYTGSGVLSSALCMDKVVHKQLLRQNNLPTPNFKVVDTQEEDISTLKVPPMPWPLVIKPAREGSSIGIHIVEENKEFYSGLKDAAQYDRFLLIEQFIKGTEMTVPIWLGRSLTPIEIAPKTGFFDFKNKYTKGFTDYHLPVRLDSKIISHCQKIATEACKKSYIKTYARVDFIVSTKGAPYIIEINTLPGFTPLSLFPMSARHEGITFLDLIKGLIENASLDYGVT